MLGFEKVQNVKFDMLKKITAKYAFFNFDCIRDKLLKGGENQWPGGAYV